MLGLSSVGKRRECDARNPSKMILTANTMIRATEAKLTVTLQKCQKCIGCLDIEDIECTNISCTTCFERCDAKQRLEYFKYIQRLVYSFVPCELIVCFQPHIME